MLGMWIACKVKNKKEYIMALEQGFNIIDSALDLALNDLEKRGMPKDEAQIALLIRLNSVVPAEILKVTELLMDDSELTAAINKSGSDRENAAIG